MEKIQDFFTAYSQAAWEKDVARMIGLYHQKVVIFDLWEQGYLTGLAAWSGVITDWLGSLGEEQVKVSFERIELHEDEKVGFGSALISYQAISPEHRILRSMKNRITLGFLKANGVWKVVQQHTSAPIDGELHAILNFE
jgi:ketosteroid isomerase-like protein